MRTIDTITGYNDIDLSFDLDASGDIKVLTDESAVKQGMNIIIQTNRGERPGVGNESFGSSVRGFLFEKVSPSLGQMIGEQILEGLEEDPRVNIENIDINKLEINNKVLGYSVEIVYNINSYQIPETLSYKIPLYTL
jgi:phage baseplate assembly protein W